MIYTVNDIANLGTILTIWAHPDDESRCAAGVMAAACQNGQRVVCVTATKGEGGQTADQTRWPKEQLADIRTHELDEALATIGVNEHYWLNYKDGSLATSDREQAASEIGEIVKKVNPDTIITFGPDGFTGHSDHITIYEWTRDAARLADSKAVLLKYVDLDEKFNSKITQDCHALFNLYYPSVVSTNISAQNADVYFELPAEIKTKKIAAIRSHQSQYSQMFAHPIGLKYFEENDGTEAFMKETV